MTNDHKPPSFLEKPQDLSIGLKDSITLQCRANPGPIKTVIKWNRIHFDRNFGVDVPPSSYTTSLTKDSRREQISSGEELNLNDIRIDDGGLYECVLENPHNHLTISHQFSITVNVPAYFKQKSDQIEVKRGETAKLICETFGAKPINIFWLRQNVQSGEFEPINFDYTQESFSFPRYVPLEKNFDSDFNSDYLSASNSDPLLKPNPFVNNNRTLFELHINSVDSFDNGLYACRSRNDFGEDLRRINLFVQDVPAAVRQLRLTQIWTSEASISWFSPDSIGNSPILHYTVQYWRETRLPNSTMVSSGYRLHEIEVPATSTTCIIKNLSPGTSYAVRVVAINQFGRGQSSQLLRFNTEEEMPSAAPIDILAESQGTSKLRIRWKAPPKSHWNGRLKGYYLGYRLISSVNDGVEDKNNLHSQNQNEPESDKRVYAYKQIEFNGLAEDNYLEEFVLTGEGPSSHEIFVSTASKDPPPKPTLMLIETKENHVVLKWNQQQKDSNEIIHYRIFFKEDKRPVWQEIEIDGSTLLHDDSDPDHYVYQLNGLNQGTGYQLYLRSLCEDKTSMSEPSNVISVRMSSEVSPSNFLNSRAMEQPFHIAAIPTVYSQPTLSTFQQTQVPPYFRFSFIVPIAVAIVIIVIACVGAYVYIRIDDRQAQMKLYSAAAAATNSYVGTLAVGPGKRFQYISPAKSTTPLNNSLTPSSFNSSGARDSSCAQSMVSEESSLSFRYSDTSSEKGRPLLARAPLPSSVVWSQQQPIPEEDEAIVDLDSSAYETLPFQKQNLQASSPLQSFNGKNTNGSDRSQTSFTSKSPSFPPPPPPLPGIVMKQQMNQSSPLNHMQQQSMNRIAPTSHSIFCHADVHHNQSSGASDANNSDSYDDFNFFSPARV
ncbi:cell adhesion molecule-like protein 7 [Sarcoptes scabiei]|uniref:Cell adhesion molecule-like protein 7 n=1 Tax=Sarcoptes scabiei TaxID=52283 RepID=A0A132A3V5_SARSC|nr:cell adhesion molecule-like protein 7 [Sarcoptes scabiei]